MSTCVATSVDVALLGCGTVGSALARLAAPDAAGPLPLRLTGALVRDIARARDRRALPALTLDPHSLLDRSPDVVVELLGGLEPARSLVLEALGRGIPVVTANKSLLAHHGAELRAAAHAAGTPLLYEAAVLAGVPFLGTFARRPHAAGIHGIVGIVNGTTNFVLGRCADGARLDAAVREAQARGYAEPDPASDLDGIDAAEKLVRPAAAFRRARRVSRRCRGGGHPRALARPDPAGAGARGHRQAGGRGELARRSPGLRRSRLRPGRASAGAGGRHRQRRPARGPARPPVLPGSGRGTRRHRRHRPGRCRGDRRGAGAAAGATAEERARHRPRHRLDVDARGGARLPSPIDVADLLAAHGLYGYRATTTCVRDAREHRSLLLHEAPRPRVERAVAAVQAAARCSVSILRALEVTP